MNSSQGKVFTPLFNSYFFFSKVLHKPQDSRWSSDLLTLPNIFKKPDLVFFLKNLSTLMKLGNCLAIVHVFHVKKY